MLFLDTAPNLEDFIITFDSNLEDKNHPLYSPDLIGQVFEAANRDRVIQSLYSKSTVISIRSKPKWMKQPGYLERLAIIISESKKLEEVYIDHCRVDGRTIKPIIAALNTAIHTMKKIKFVGTDWNSDDAVEELVKFIATAPKLEECSINL